MCRFFGFRSNTPAGVHRSLLTEKNSLRKQSSEHRDGWGIAYYDRDPLPQVAHGVGPAHTDPEFERVSNLLSSRAVLAHIRLASIGGVHLRNAHPFQYRRWAFAHNGTVSHFQQCQAHLEEAIDPEFRPLLRSETDSERCFYIFLTELKSRSSSHAATVDDVVRALDATTALVSKLADRDGNASSLNFLVTNGELMVGTRRHKTLFFSAKPASGSTAAPLHGTRLSQLVIASERLCGEDHWQAVPEKSAVSVDAEMILRLHPNGHPSSP